MPSKYNKHILYHVEFKNFKQTFWHDIIIIIFMHVCMGELLYIIIIVVSLFHYLTRSLINRKIIYNVKSIKRNIIMNASQCIMAEKLI